METTESMQNIIDRICTENRIHWADNKLKRQGGGTLKNDLYYTQYIQMCVETAQAPLGTEDYRLEIEKCTKIIADIKRADKLSPVDALHLPEIENFSDVIELVFEREGLSSDAKGERFFTKYNDVSAEFVQDKILSMGVKYKSSSFFNTVTESWTESEMKRQINMYLKEKHYSSLQELRENMHYREECSEYTNSIIEYLVTEMAMHGSDEMNTAMFKEMVLQVKRNLFNKKVHDPRLFNFFGSTGIGKTEIVRAIFKPLRDYTSECTLADLMDSRDISLATENYITFLDELKFDNGTGTFRTKSDSDSAIKQEVTAEFKDGRVLGSHRRQKSRKINTNIGTSNYHFNTRINDHSSMRRYYQFQLTINKLNSQLMDFMCGGLSKTRLEGAFDAVKFFQGIDEDKLTYVDTTELKRELREVQEGYKRPTEIDTLANKAITKMGEDTETFKNMVPSRFQFDVETDIENTIDVAGFEATEAIVKQYGFGLVPLQKFVELMSYASSDSAALKAWADVNLKEGVYLCTQLRLRGFVLAEDRTGVVPIQYVVMGGTASQDLSAITEHTETLRDRHSGGSKRKRGLINPFENFNKPLEENTVAVPVVVPNPPGNEGLYSFANAGELPCIERYTREDIVRWVTDLGWTTDYILTPDSTYVPLAEWLGTSD